MTADNGPQTVLIFNERARSVLPYSSDALSLSGGPKKRVLQRYLGAIVVDRDGTVRRIESIQFLGLRGRSVWRRAVSLINGYTRRISVTLRPVPGFGFEDVCWLAVEYLGKDPGLAEYFEQGDPGAILRKVKLSLTYAELFDALEAPVPADCLDILS